MDIKKINDGLSVSPQVLPADMPAIADAGIRSVICNRPDGEGADQPSHEQISDAARAAGLELRYVPIVPGNVTEADILAFDAALRELPGPVLAYCRSGARSTNLWSAVEARRSGG